MATAEGYSAGGDKTGAVTLPDGVFGIEPNAHVVWESVVNFQARSRDIIEEMRVLATRNAEEIRESVEDGKQRLARLIQQGGTLPPPSGV